MSEFGKHRTHTVTGGGDVVLHVDECGPPDGRPVVFVHGLSSSHLAWSRQVGSDLAADFRLVRFDLRGHGRSDKPRGAYADSRLWADDLEAVITGLDLDLPVLVGWSYGGLVITDYVRHYGENKVGAISYVDALTSNRTDTAQSGIGARFVEIVRGLVSADYEDSIAAQAALIRLCVREEPEPEDAYRMLGYSVVVPPHVRADLLRRVADNDDVLRGLTVPTLVSHGGCDEIVLPATAEHTLDLVTHAEPSWYRDVGHSPFWEEPERFNHELRELVEEAADLGR